MDEATLTHIQRFRYFPDRLLAARRPKFRSAAIVAQLLHVSPKTIQRVESGRAASLSLVERYCALVGLPLSEAVQPLSEPNTERRGRRKALTAA